MSSRVSALLFALAVGGALAQQRGTPGSNACRQALDALDAKEALAASAPATGRRDAVKQLETARRLAARACLGGTGEPPPPSVHFTQPLQAVPPAASRVPAPVVRTPPAAVSLPPPNPPPTIVTGCDPGGCWTSDGSRLQRVGPGALMGPRGLCTSQGPIVQCP